jgi:hypothetical protein
MRREYSENAITAITGRGVVFPDAHERHAGRAASRAAAGPSATSRSSCRRSFLTLNERLLLTAGVVNAERTSNNGEDPHPLRASSTSFSLSSIFLSLI